MRSWTARLTLSPRRTARLTLSPHIGPNCNLARDSSRRVEVHLDCRPVAEPGPAYLIAGDDDAKLDAWRARVRERADAEGGPGALESFDARSAGPDRVAAALAELSLAMGTRYLLVEGVEAWRAGALEPLERALGQMPPDTVLVLIARGPKVAARLESAVESAGGEVRRYAGPKPWEMPRWATERAAERGLALDSEAAKALVAAVGDRRPQRIVRELEKLALAAHPAAEVSAEDVGRLAAGEITAGAYDVADALVAGDRAAAFALAVELRAGEDRPTRLVFPIVRRLREVHRAAGLLEAGGSERQVAQALGIPPWAAKRVVSRAGRADRDALERALCAFAELEVETRAGGGVDEDTAFSLALAAAAD